MKILQKMAFGSEWGRFVYFDEKLGKKEEITLKPEDVLQKSNKEREQLKYEIGYDFKNDEELWSQLLQFFGDSNDFSMVHQALEYMGTQGYDKKNTELEGKKITLKDRVFLLEDVESEDKKIKAKLPEEPKKINKFSKEQQEMIEYSKTWVFRSRFFPDKIITLDNFLSFTQDDEIILEELEDLKHRVVIFETGKPYFDKIMESGREELKRWVIGIFFGERGGLSATFEQVKPYFDKGMKSADEETIIRVIESVFGPFEQRKPYYDEALNLKNEKVRRSMLKHIDHIKLLKPYCDELIKSGDEETLRTIIKSVATVGSPTSGRAKFEQIKYYFDKGIQSGNKETLRTIIDIIYEMGTSITFDQINLYLRKGIKVENEETKMLVVFILSKMGFTFDQAKQWMKAQGVTKTSWPKYTAKYVYYGDSITFFKDEIKWEDIYKWTQKQ